MGEEPDCTPWLVKYGKMLKMAGANFLVVICNTAHGFYERVQPQLDIPWIHLMNTTGAFIKSNYPQCRRIGVLATTGTLQAKIYEDSLSALGLTVISPPIGSQLQRNVMDAIYNPVWGVKATGTDILPEPVSYTHLTLPTTSRV